jgi:hypothetical protein
VVTALAIALAACSDGQAAPSAPPAPATSPTTTAVPVTTSTSTTVSTAPPTTEDPEIAAVREAHLAFLAMFGVVGDPPDPDHPELARVATGDAYDRLRANLAQDQLAGNRIGGGYSSSVVGVEVAGDDAVVTDCSLDLGVLYGPDGSTLIEADSDWRLRTSRLRREDGVWRVWRLDTPDPAIPCGG